MKNAAFFLLLLVFAPFQTLLGQQLVSSIRGTVTDAQSQQALIGATVMVLNSDPSIGTSTDAFGNYLLEKVPIGRLSI